MTNKEKAIQAIREFIEDLIKDNDKIADFIGRVMECEHCPFRGRKCLDREFLFLNCSEKLELFLDDEEEEYRDDGLGKMDIKFLGFEIGEKCN